MLLHPLDDVAMRSLISHEWNAPILASLPLIERSVVVRQHVGHTGPSRALKNTLLKSFLHGTPYLRKRNFLSEKSGDEADLGHDSGHTLGVKTGWLERMRVVPVYQACKAVFGWPYLHLPVGGIGE